MGPEQAPAPEQTPAPEQAPATEPASKQEGTGNVALPDKFTVLQKIFQGAHEASQKEYITQNDLDTMKEKQRLLNDAIKSFIDEPDYGDKLFTEYINAGCPVSDIIFKLKEEGDLLLNGYTETSKYVKANPTTAVKLYEKALELYPLAINKGESTLEETWGLKQDLAELYEEGRPDFEVNLEKAFELYKQLADDEMKEQPHEFSDNALKVAEMLFQGNGTPQNCLKAIEIYKKEAEKGNSEAQYRLGFIMSRRWLNSSIPLYNEGDGIEWIERAADKYHMGACAELVRKYTEYSETYARLDYKEKANKYSEKAKDYLNIIAEQAKESDPEAQYNLALLYIRGEGVKQNYAKAYILLENAVKQYYKDAKEPFDMLLNQGRILLKLQVFLERINKIFRG